MIWTRMQTIWRRCASTQSDRCRPCRSLNRRRRGRPLYRPLRNRRVAKAVLIGAIPPLMLKTDGESRRYADRGIRQAPRRGPGRSLAVLQGPQPALLRLQPARREVSEGVRDSFWRQGMRPGFRPPISASRRFPRPIYRGPEEDRRPDTDPPRRRRPDRSDRRLRMLSSKSSSTRPRRVYQGRAARHVHDAQGPGERGPRGVHRRVSAMAAIGWRDDGRAAPRVLELRLCQPRAPRARQGRFGR